jgi:glutathione S-transferase
MKLLVASPSPYARKVRIALLEKGLDFDTLLDLPWNPAAKAPGMNPLGKVPALALDDGRVLYDSRVIIEYLETLGRGPALLPAEPLARVEHRQIEALADGVCDAIVLTVLERARAPALQSADWIARQRVKIEAGFAEAARLLGDKPLFIAGRLGLADIAVGCMLAYAELRLAQLAWRSLHPNLDRLSRRLEARPSFRQTRPEAQPIATVR